MRLDKFLKVSRVFKRRTVAKEIADHNRVYINGRVAKPASNVEPDDIIKIVYGNKEFTIKVLEIQNQASKDAAMNMYEVVEEKNV
jgi:ribosomal 50S subunit-recycling heat shock protein